MKTVLEGYEYSPSEAALVMGLVCAAGIISIASNTWILIGYRKEIKSGERFSRHLIISLAGLDLSRSILVIMMGTYQLILKYPGVYSNNWYCSVLGSLLNYFTGLSWLWVSFLAIERFLAVVYEKPVSDLIGWILLIIVTIIMGIPALMNGLDQGFIPDPTYTHCWYTSSYWGHIATISLACSFFISVSILSVTYLCISLHLVKKANALSSHNELIIYAAIKCIMILFLYYLCLSPKIVSLILYHTYPEYHPHLLNILSPVGITLSIAINPLLIISALRRPGCKPSRIDSRYQSVQSIASPVSTPANWGRSY